MPKLGNQRVVRRAVSRNEQIISKDHHKQKDRVDPALLIHRRPENKHRRKSQRKRRPFQKRDSPPVFRCAAVGQRCDHGIREGIKDASQRCDSADHRDDAENGKPLRDEHGLSLRDCHLIRLIEIHQPVRNDSGQHGPPKLPRGKLPYFTRCQLLHCAIPPRLIHDCIFPIV